MKSLQSFSLILSLTDLRIFFSLLVKAAALPKLNTGFNLGKAAAFTNNEKKILKSVNDRIKEKDCKDFINKILADNHVAADRNTLDKLLAKADLNTYNEDLTDIELGVSKHDLITLRDAFNVIGAPEVY